MSGPYGWPEMIEVRACADEREEKLSLDVYNAVWPHEAVTMEEVRHFKAAMVDNVDLVAWSDGEVVGSGFATVVPQRPNLPDVLLTVLPEARGRGAGTALYSAISSWTKQHGLDELEAVVGDDDPESLSFAERRGFREDRREKGVALLLAEIEAPAVEPPDGIEIVSWAERPELSRGIYEVALEASPDVPGWEDEIMEPFEKWLASSSRAPARHPSPTACSRRCCSPTSSARRSARPSSVTAAGGSCSTRITPRCAASSSASAAARSIRPETASWPASRGRPAPSATGECEVAGDKLAGIAVHIGARVTGRAAPGEVLVSSTVRDLVAGSGLEFEERGSAELKGVPGEWRL